jgi:hypothetical protein
MGPVLGPGFLAQNFDADDANFEISPQCEPVKELFHGRIGNDVDPSLRDEAHDRLIDVIVGERWLAPDLPLFHCREHFTNEGSPVESRF